MDLLIEYLKRSIRPKNSSEFYETDVFDLIVFANMKQDGIMITKSSPPKNLSFAEYVKVGSFYIIKKTFKNLEWLNNDNTFSFSNSSGPIYRRLLPPPDESVNHALIIKSVLQENDPSEKTYIEYGVRWGDNMSKISPLVKKSYGVDIQDPQSIPENCLFYKCLTDEFSKKTLPDLKYHFAFIDADHKFESCFKDFQYIYEYLQPNGYIFLHDTYPCEERFLDPGACNDCYKTPIEIKKNYPNLEILTLPLNPGFTIIRKQ
jgi:hypothetical protein